MMAASEREERPDKLDQSLEHLNDFGNGPRNMHYFRNGELVDDTLAWHQKTKCDIERFDRLIAADEELDATANGVANDA